MYEASIEEILEKFTDKINSNIKITDIDILEHESRYFDIYTSVSFFFYSFYCDLVFKRDLDGNESIRICNTTEHKKKVFNTIRQIDKQIHIYNYGEI